ncbi:MAG TPA: radical SAM protein [Candidatus Hydrogenedentes bacterium]|jgi:MoaA/NifB/PqqE/SkfB family radical SAM enzyme|nr:MAG: Antilisterial bacteriocin subtilosin biosynthesis protein AlbA [Candidatus Hydrogenedentes bacterium ADurb.Bin170]HNZ48641.1 radical SAM protein [Candidatus Hydrogenedentota bacterium]HOD94745.1 radical SAM protein [Candidatus Hydrogenedentota bacterium]HOH41826.1 radical SAM protein [Candidatus Hydrogenedentota bacterium]HOR50233.1 radical SAM protein [Candidatus Hydrogenedentota bacterium]
MAGLNYRRMLHAGTAGLKLLRGVLGLGRVPLFLSWNITFRCNLRCAYCGASDAPRREMSAEEILAGTKEMYKLGARWITFGGGEPLLRSDIGEILHGASEQGYQVFLSTNGSLLPKKIELLPAVDHINLSLDGPREIHDQVRGEGAFAGMMKGADAAAAAGISYSFLCTLGAHNLNVVEETVRIARERQVWVMFQPATLWLDSSTADNPVAAQPEQYREAMEQLMALKAAGAPIANSRAGLRHLAQWPNHTKIRCLAGRLSVVIEPDGTMLSCHQYEVGRFLEQTGGSGIRMGEQFRNLIPPRGCTQCWCAPVVELALIASFNPEAFWNSFRRVFKE